MSTEPSTGITPADLHAYFDDELMPDQAATVAEAIESDPQLQMEHQQLVGLRGTVNASLEAAAAAVPSARFEQIWDEIDRAIERDARLQAEADRNASVWTRLWAALRPVRLPALAATAAAAAAVFIIGPGADDSNKADPMASVAKESPAPEPKTNPVPSPEPAQPKLASNDSTTNKSPSEPEPQTRLKPMPVPEVHDAEILSIEFGSRGGSISNSGTVTVLYVEEDDTQTNSERSL